MHLIAFARQDYRTAMIYKILFILKILLTNQLPALELRGGTFNLILCSLFADPREQFGNSTLE